MFPRHPAKLILIGLALIVTLASTYAFASSNAVAPPRLGVGQGAISGYVVSNVAFHNNDQYYPEEKGWVGYITFNLNREARIVQVYIPDGIYSYWSTCELAGYTPDPYYFCNASNIPWQNLVSLRVVARD